ncbi:MAG TPA: cytosine permease [Candidatus Scybalomonas excrementigallinarum]|nr:cytosine permease [Candidatus Scybalomonas excrementigallinarum]
MGDELQVEVDSEFSRSSVPKDQRRSYFNLTIVWTGYVFVITSMMAGGGLAAGLNFKQLLLAMIVGNVFLSIIAVSISVIACKTGLTFALMSRYSFGVKGSKIASIFVPIVNLGWYTIQAATYGHFIAQIFNLNGIGEGIAMALSAIVMGIFAMLGFNALTILGYVAIPAIIFLSIATAIRSVDTIGGIGALLQYQPAETMTIFAGITAVIGQWILSTSTCIADIMRYAKSPKQATASALTGLFGGNILMIVCGAVAAIALNNSDLTVVLLEFGLVFPSIILMTTNIFTTNAANLYSTSMNLSNSFRMKREKMMVILLVLSALGTLLKPYEVSFLFQFLDILGTIVPPLAGIILSDYFFIHRGTYAEFEKAKFKDWNIIPWISWIVSAIIVVLVPVGLPSLNGMILGGVIYTVLMVATKQKIVEV